MLHWLQAARAMTVLGVVALAQNGVAFGEGQQSAGGLVTGFGSDRR